VSAVPAADDRPAGLAGLAAATLLASFTGPDVPAWLQRRVDAGLGGVCLFGSNLGTRPATGARTGAPPPIDAGVEAVARVSARLHAPRPTLLVALDEEGGDVTRLEAYVGSSVPGNAALGAVDDTGLTRSIAYGLGLRLVEAGVDLDLAPCADANVDPANPVIGVRSFGADPSLVARHVAAVVEGLQAAGVAACAKHFPGHGATRVDSHLDLPVVDAPADVLRGRELVPFAAAIAAGSATIMLGHLRMPAFGDEPATVNRRMVTGLLRDELGFQGAVVTDALDMRGIGGPRAIPTNAVRAVAAGADFCCLGPDATDDLIGACIDALVTAVHDGTLGESRLTDAATRVAKIAVPAAASPSPLSVPASPSLAYPAASATADHRGRDVTPSVPPSSLADAAARVGGVDLRSPSPSASAIRGPAVGGRGGDVVPSSPLEGLGAEAAWRALRVAGELGGAVGAAHVVELRSVPNIAAGVVPWGVAEPLTVLEPTTTSEQIDPGAAGESLWAGVLDRARGRRLVVVVRDGRRRPVTAKVVQALVAARPDAVVIDMGWPSGDAEPAGTVHISTFGASRASGEAVAQLLAGREAPTAIGSTAEGSGCG
jgi:beta-N-acetylhexosaminidase